MRAVVPARRAAEDAVRVELAAEVQRAGEHGRCAYEPCDVDSGECVLVGKLHDGAAAVAGDGVPGVEVYGEAGLHPCEVGVAHVVDLVLVG